MSINKGSGFMENQIISGKTGRAVTTTFEQIKTKPCRRAIEIEDTPELALVVLMTNSKME